MREETVQKPKKKKKWLFFLILLLVIGMAALGVIAAFQIKSVEITGNEHYTDEEIRELVMGDAYSNNGLYLYLKYQYGETEPIPFIDKIEVTLESNSKVKIRVYEKSIVGYVSYMGANLYFDKDGVVVENSSEVMEGVPCITGLEFHALTLYKPLAVKNKAVFKTIVDVTQLMTKYELTPDRIEFRNDTEVVLHFENVRVMLGEDDMLDDKVATVKKLLPELSGKSGVLHMEEGIDLISFRQDKE